MQLTSKIFVALNFREKFQIGFSHIGKQHIHDYIEQEFSCGINDKNKCYFGTHSDNLDLTSKKDEMMSQTYNPLI